MSEAVPAGDVRFVFMADCQLGCYASFSGLTEADVESYAARGMTVRASPSTTGWAWDAGRLRAAVERVRALRPAFVVVGGDMVDDAQDAGQYAELRTITAALDGIPVHWVPGNHDCAHDANVPTPDSLAAYRARFGPDAYDFRHDGIAGIVVNTVVLARPEQVGDELQRQLSDLEERLVRARADGSRHILVFGHHPLFTVEADEPDSYWNIPLDRRRRVLGLLREHGARAFFCGHWHRNGGGWDHGVEVVVTGPVGYPLGADPSGLRIVDVSEQAVAHQYVALEASEQAVAG